MNDGFKFNRETEFVPIAGLVEADLSKTESSSTDTKTPGASSIQENHHPALLALLAEELSVAPQEIHDFELYALSPCSHGLDTDLLFRHLYDVQPATFAGLKNEFIFSPRLDNQFSSLVLSRSTGMHDTNYVVLGLPQ